MLIALDYHLTYSADPSFWSAVCQLAKQHGHAVVGVCRYAPGRTPPEMPVPVVCAGHEGGSVRPLALAVDDAGHGLAQVWITASPASVQPSPRSWDPALVEEFREAVARSAGPGAIQSVL